MHNYGPISIPTEFQTNTLNNKDVKEGGGGGGRRVPPPGQGSTKNSPDWIYRVNNIFVVNYNNLIALLCSLDK